MKTVSMSVLVSLVMFGHGCAAEVEENGEREESLSFTENALSHDCQSSFACQSGYLRRCRAGDRKMCRKYSARCSVRIGVIGDSASDEYQGFAQLPGAQWTEQVQSEAHISLGAYEPDPELRGEPRNDGYALNWARTGQAALDLQWNDTFEHPAIIAQGIPGIPQLQSLGSFDAQIEGLGAQIAADQVDVALVWVGHNDLFIRYFIGYEEDGGEAAFYHALKTRIVSAAEALQGYAGTDPADLKAKVAIVGLNGVASAFNPVLSAAAADAGIPFVDPYNPTMNAVVTEQAATGAFHIGDLALTPFELVFEPAFEAIPKVASPTALSPRANGPCNFLGCATPEYAEAALHYDGIHTNTLYIGLVGNQLLRDLNETFGFAMRTIPDAQLLATAGL